MSLREKPVYLLPDLKGPQGNAFFMMAEVLGLLRRTGYTPEECALIQSEMMSGDYDHFLDCVFRYCEVYMQVNDFVPIDRKDVIR